MRSKYTKTDHNFKISSFLDIGETLLTLLLFKVESFSYY